jgi:hypothetical protein
MTDVQKYANIYVQKKAELLPLMELAYGSIPKDATHDFLIKLYIQLLKDNRFKEEVDKIAGFKNAVDPITAIAEGVGSVAGAIGGIFTSRQQEKNIEAQAEANSDEAMYQLILSKQGQDNTGKIIIFAGIALIVVGGIITVIILKRKK